MLNRIRQRDSLFSGTISFTTKAKTYPWQQLSSCTLPIVGGTCQKVEDYYVKRKFRPSKDGVPPMNDVIMSKISFDVPQKGPMLCVYENSDYIWRAEGQSVAAAPFTNGMSAEFTPPTNSSMLNTTQVQSQVASYLLQRAYSKMSTPERNMGVSLGEIAETASMLAKPLSGIVKLSSKAFAGCKGLYSDGTRAMIKVAKNATSRQLRVLKKSTIQHPTNSSLRILDETANHWLAYKFGVCPLIEDVAGYLKMVEDEISPTFGLKLAKVKGYTTDITSSVMMNNMAVFSQAYDQLIYNNFAVKRTIDYHTCGLYWRNRVTSPLVNFLEQTGLAHFQFPALVYELIPLSFVVDRFIDIKSFVRGNLGSTEDLKETFGNYVSRKVTTVWSNSIQDIRLSSAGRPLAKVNQRLSSSATLSMVARSINNERPKFPVVNPYWQQQLQADMTNMSLIWGRLRTFVGKI